MRQRTSKWDFVALAVAGLLSPVTANAATQAGKAGLVMGLALPLLLLLFWWMGILGRGILLLISALLVLASIAMLGYGFLFIGLISMAFGIFLIVCYSIYRDEGGFTRLLIVAGLCGGTVAMASHVALKPASDAHLQPVRWIKEKKTRWPQIVLTNRARFRGHSDLKGASAFLLKTPKGEVVGATARHLLGEAGGVQPELPVGALDQALVTWYAYPRTRPSQSVAFVGVAADGLDDPTLDWLLLKPKPGTPVHRYEALQVRHKPVEVGETVHLIGCPYSEEFCRQRVYSGRVIRREAYHMFRFSIDPPVELSGFSGAPIIDANGHLIGVMTVSFEPARTSAGYVEAGGQDVGQVGSMLAE